MDVTSFDHNRNSESDQRPLLMERTDTHSDTQHVIDIARNGEATTSTSSQEAQHHPETDLNHRDDRSSSIGPTLENSSSSLSRFDSRDSTLARRGEGYERRRRSPLDSGLWMSIELVVTVGQIIASVTVLILARNEKPQAPLFAWVVGYASGCVLTLPVLFWRFRNRSRISTNDPSSSHQFQNNAPDSTTYTPISSTQPSEEENFRPTDSATAIRNDQTPRPPSERLNRMMDHLKIALDCFFAVWFVVGNVWIFGGHSNPADAPKLYKLCIVFLTFSCIGYAMPFILCATICCCLPCIISILGFREDFSQTRGATVEAINILPTYKFNLKKSDNANAHENDGGVLAAGTEKERTISAEDALCCICLNKYADDDELRELPCIHVFHVECVDKWLKINASCPLCKCELGESSNAPSPADSGQD
ncbi:RING/U-box superfamily protein [Euphorbia peplus]|nr:RING/U-box superfamily protein [Euphorbia peplus]